MVDSAIAAVPTVTAVLSATSAEIAYGLDDITKADIIASAATGSITSVASAGVAESLIDEYKSQLITSTIAEIPVVTSVASAGYAITIPEELVSTIITSAINSVPDVTSVAFATSAQIAYGLDDATKEDIISSATTGPITSVASAGVAESLVTEYKAELITSTINEIPVVTSVMSATSAEIAYDIDETLKSSIISSAALSPVTHIDFASGYTISAWMNGTGQKYTTGDGDGTYVPVGSGLGGVLMGNIYAPAGATSNWTATLSIGAFGASGGSGVALLHPTECQITNGVSTYGVIYQPMNAYVYIPIEPETKFFIHINDQGIGSGTNDLKFFPRVPIESSSPTPGVPEAPIPYAIPTSATMGDVTVYADYSPNSIQKQAQIENSGWINYPSGGVVVSSNCIVYFRGGNDSGYSEVASYAVTNIDKVPPTMELYYDNTTTNLPYDTITAVTEAGATIQYRSSGASSWTTYTEPINVYENGTWEFRATDAAGNTTTETITYANILSGHETPGDDSEEDPED